MRAASGLLMAVALGCLAAEPVTLVDFTKAGHGWKGNPRARAMPGEGGLSVELTGDDPWVEGPAVAVPEFGKAQKLAVTLEAESAHAGSCELFYAAAGKGFSAGASVQLTPSLTDSNAYTGLIPLTADHMRFRIDPPGSAGRFTLRALRAVPLVPMAAPTFERPVPVTLPENALSVSAGTVRIVHDPARWNAFACEIGGQKMAEANPSEALAYWDGRRVVPVSLATADVVAMRVAGGFVVKVKAHDAEGAVWQVERRFLADRGAVRIETALEVSVPREVIHLPWLTLFAGVGSFGEHKRQAVLPGVEYLDDEPSSNEKEVKGAAANRRIVDAYKVCYPMMALVAEGRWLSVVWQAGELPVSPLFDSPDRVFCSGGHVLGVWSPAVGEARFESEWVLYGGSPLQAGKKYVCTTTLCGGSGSAVTEAVGDYVARTGLPPVPRYADGFDDAVRLLSAGWLDSAARQGTRWRHAVWGDRFPPGVAEDVPAYLLWLAANASDAALKVRLRETAQAAIASLPKGCSGIGGVSHAKRPTGALLYGDLAGVVNRAKVRAAHLAAQLAQGEAHYKPAADKPDYASTLGSDACNGFTSLTAEEMLADASFTGDETVIAAVLAVLDKMTAAYGGQVPRGAQPWEMPLHTPDIVASARLVRCYVLGYLLSGKSEYLEQARYWAWTGVTMVYLAPPTKGEVGLYATIGVIGATNWQAPNWIGQPVQWCGLVYRSALADLARVDEAQRGTWETLARGITITGLQMCFPVNDPQQRGGLLPDYYLLKQQLSDGPAINPGTVQEDLAEAYGKTPMVTTTRLAKGSLVHVPGEVRQEETADGALKLAVTAWPEDGYRLLITRVAHAPSKALWNGTAVAPQFIEGARVLIVPLKGSGRLDITY